MNHELLHIVDQISREKGIGREALLETVEQALVSAARKLHGYQSIRVSLDPKSGQITMARFWRVVDPVTNPEEELTLEEARQRQPDCELGGEVAAALPFGGFGRIAAQTAKQVILQRVKEVERENIFKDYKDREGTILNGQVLRQEKGAYILDLGKTDAVLPAREQIPREGFRRGDRVRALLIEVKMSVRGPQLTVSRSHPQLVARLFEMEVPEIYEGIVQIKGVSREAGDRTKIAVVSRDRAVDPVGACVGMKGSRVQAVVRELRGEKIDIVPWTDNPTTLIANALSPAIVERVAVTPEDKTALVLVSDQQLSLAIGKKGQNVRLAAKLTGWKIDILSETEYDQERQKVRDREIEEAISRERIKLQESEEGEAPESPAASEPPAAAPVKESEPVPAPLPAGVAGGAAGAIPVIEIPGVGAKTAQVLAEHGYATAEELAQAGVEALQALPGIGRKMAEKIVAGAQELLGSGVKGS